MTSHSPGRGWVWLGGVRQERTAMADRRKRKRRRRTMTTVMKHQRTTTRIIATAIKQASDLFAELPCSARAQEISLTLGKKRSSKSPPPDASLHSQTSYSATLDSMLVVAVISTSEITFNYHAARAWGECSSATSPASPRSAWTPHAAADTLQELRFRLLELRVIYGDSKWTHRRSPSARHRGLHLQCQGG